MANYCQFSCICTVIDHELCENIVKVAVVREGDRPVDLKTTLTMLLMSFASVQKQMEFHVLFFQHRGPIRDFPYTEFLVKNHDHDHWCFYAKSQQGMGHSDSA